MLPTAIITLAVINSEGAWLCVQVNTGMSSGVFEANMGEELLAEVDNGELIIMVNRVSDDEGVETCTLVIS